MPIIHPTALVDPDAELAEDVTIQAFALIGPGVSIGAGTVVYSNSVIHGRTAIGAGCKIGPAAYIGLDPQHLEFLSRPERPETWLEIGDRTIIRETATLHRSTKTGRDNATKVGSDCLLMGSTHVAHDCRVGDRVIMANSALLGGHCHVGDRAFMGGGSIIHQFCRIGRLAIISGNEAVSRDIPPYAAARYGGLKGYNAVGCRRSGMTRESIHTLRAAFYCLHHHRTTSGAVRAIRTNCPQTPEVLELLEFIAGSKRGIHPSLRFLNYLNADHEE